MVRLGRKSCAVRLWERLIGGCGAGLRGKGKGREALCGEIRRMKRLKRGGRRKMRDVQGRKKGKEKEREIGLRETEGKGERKGASVGVLLKCSMKRETKRNIIEGIKERGMKVKETEGRVGKKSTSVGV